MLNKNDFSMFNDIHASKELKNKVLNKTVNKNNVFVHRKIPKFVVNIIIVLVIALVGCGGVLASDLIHKYILTKTIDEDGWNEQYVELNNPVNIKQDNNVTCDNITNLKDLEEGLGIKFVFDTEKYNSQINKCDIRYNESGKIESVEVSVFGFVDFDEYNKTIDPNYKANITNSNFMERNEELKILDVSIAFKTPYASDETNEEFKKIGKIISNYKPENVEFYLPNINTYGYYNTFPSKYIDLSKDAIFVHNNIFYYFGGNNKVTLDELLDLLNKF